VAITVVTMCEKSGLVSWLLKNARELEKDFFRVMERVAMTRES